MNNLKQNVSTLIQKNADLQVLLNVEKNVPYNLVIQVLDHIRLAGCYNIVLQAEKKHGIQ